MPKGNQTVNNSEYRQHYLKYVAPFAENRPRIILSDTKREKINNLAKRIIAAKVSESHHKIDSFNELKRFTTGLLGESAMEELLGVEIVDFSVGDSSVFNIADLNKLGYDIGIKTVEVWKFPIIHKNVKRPEIINVLRDEKTVVCFGYASKRVLEAFQSDVYILSPSLRARGTKTGFYGFQHLIPITCLDDVINAYNKYDK